MVSPPPHRTGIDGESDQAQLALRYRWLQRAWAVSWLLLLAVSWRLWLPHSDFPRVPLIALPAPPAALEWLLLAGLVAAVLASLLLRGVYQISTAMLVFALLAVALVLLNQHRLQPWFYQTMILATVFASLDARRGLSALRWLAIGIYFYSSLGKFDFQFLHTVGPQFLDAATALVGVDATAWSEAARVRAAIVFPLVELVVAIGLVSPATRRAAAWLGVLMHLSTIVLLGPLGLAHRPGVLLWNAAMTVQLGLLFCWPLPTSGEKATGETTTDTRAQRRVLPPMAGLVVFWLAMMLPLLERFGYWDHWPSWALYSPHNSRVDVQLHASAVHKLPQSLQNFLSEPDDQGWRSMDLDRWSIDSLGVPIYPQARFQLGVAAALIEQHDLQRDSRVQIRGIADRWTGSRQVSRATGRMGLDAEIRKFWLNARPRTAPPQPRW